MNFLGLVSKGLGYWCFSDTGLIDLINQLLDQRYMGDIFHTRADSPFFNISVFTTISVLERKY